MLQQFHTSPREQDFQSLAQGLREHFLNETPPPDGVEVKSLRQIPKAKLKFQASLSIKVLGFRDHNITVLFESDPFYRVNKKSLMFV